MNSKIVFLLVFMGVLQAAAQPIELTPQAIPTNYLQKSKGQKTTGIVLVSAGSVGLIATLLSDASQAIGGGLTTVFSLGTVEPEYKSYTAQYIVSAAGVVGGIALLAAASKNKRKVRPTTVFIDMEKYQTLQAQGVINKSFPVAGLKVQF